MKVLLLNSFGILRRELWKVLTFSASYTTLQGFNIVWKNTRLSISYVNAMNFSRTHCSIDEIVVFDIWEQKSPQICLIRFINILVSKPRLKTQQCSCTIIFIHFQNLSISGFSFHSLEIGKMCVASPFTLIAAPAPQGLNLLSEDVNYVRGDIFSPNPQ